MANANRPMGLSPVRYLNGAPWSGAANIYSVPSGNATILSIGDPVITTGSADTNGIAGVALAAATGPIRGVIVGIGTLESLMGGGVLGSTANLAASTAGYVMVADDPNIIFEVQEHSNGTALAATEVGLNQVLVLGTTNGYVSGWTLASATDATPNTTATLQVRLLGLARKADNAFGAYAKWLVLINAHELRVGSAGL